MANDKRSKTAEANKKFYEKERARSWKGGSVPYNQTKPKNGSRKAFDPGKVTDRDDFDHKDAQVSRARRSGEMDTYVARKQAISAANRAGQKLTRTPRSGTAGLKPKTATAKKAATTTKKTTPKKAAPKLRGK